MAQKKGGTSVKRCIALEQTDSGNSMHKPIKKHPVRKVESKLKKNSKKNGRKKTSRDYEESDSDEECFCLVCVEPYSNSNSREEWIQCTLCCG